MTGRGPQRYPLQKVRHPKNTVFSVQRVEWARISAFRFMGQKTAKSRRGPRRSGDRIHSFRHKTVVLSCFSEALSITCSRLLAGFLGIPTKCACPPFGTRWAAHNLALKLRNVPEPRVGTQGTESSVSGGGTPGTSFWHPF